MMRLVIGMPASLVPGFVLGVNRRQHTAVPCSRRNPEPERPNEPRVWLGTAAWKHSRAGTARTSCSRRPTPRVFFGSGKAAEHLAAEVTRTGARRVMVIASEAESSIAENVARDFNVTLNYNDVSPHVPVEKAEKARSAAAEHGIDLLCRSVAGRPPALPKPLP